MKVGLETLECNPNTEYLEESWNNFKIVIFSAAEAVCEKCRKGRKKKKQIPWWTEEVKEEFKKINQLCKKYLRTKSTEDYKN
jgi:Leu/Phe-tRNA-protein transferase